MLRFLTIEIVAVEIESFLVEVGAECTCAAVQEFPFQIILDVLKVGVEDIAVEADDEIGHADVEAVESRGTKSIEIVIPIEDW